MAESTLSLTFEDLARSTAFYAGYGRKADTSEGLTSAQVANVAAANKQGYSRFLSEWNWSFLCPRVVFTLWKTATGTATVSGTTVTATAAAFYPSMIGHTILIESILNGTFAAATDWTTGAGWSISGGVGVASNASANLTQTVAPLLTGLTYRVTFDIKTRTAGSITPVVGGVSGTARSAVGTYTEDIVAGSTAFAFSTSTFTGTIDNVQVQAIHTITAYTSTTVVTIAATGTTSSKAFSVPADGIYRLPDDFGEMDSEHIHFGANTSDPRLITLTSEFLVLDALQLTTQASRPTIAAVRPLSASAGTGQRFDLVTAPVSDANYAVNFRYNVHPDALTTGQYPYGGMKHGETIRLAGLAAMEAMLNDGETIQQALYQQALARSKLLDQRQSRSERLGISYDREYWSTRSGERGADCIGATVGGIQY